MPLEIQPTASDLLRQIRRLSENERLELFRTIKEELALSTLPNDFTVRQLALSKPATMGFTLLTTLVDQLGGTIEIDQKNGCCVRIRFPIAVHDEPVQ